MAYKFLPVLFFPRGCDFAKPTQNHDFHFSCNTKAMPDQMRGAPMADCPQLQQQRVQEWWTFAVTLPQKGSLFWWKPACPPRKENNRARRRQERVG